MGISKAVCRMIAGAASSFATLENLYRPTTFATSTYEHESKSHLFARDQTPSTTLTVQPGDPPATPSPIAPPSLITPLTPEQNARSLIGATLNNLKDRGRAKKCDNIDRDILFNQTKTFLSHWKPESPKHSDMPDVTEKAILERLVAYQIIHNTMKTQAQQDAFPDDIVDECRSIAKLIIEDGVLTGPIRVQVPDRVQEIVDTLLRGLGINPQLTVPGQTPRPACACPAKPDSALELHYDWDSERSLWICHCYRFAYLRKDAVNGRPVSKCLVSEELSLDDSKPPQDPPTHDNGPYAQCRAPLGRQRDAQDIGAAFHNWQPAGGCGGGGGAAGGGAFTDDRGRQGGGRGRVHYLLALSEPGEKEERNLVGHLTHSTATYAEKGLQATTSAQFPPCSPSNSPLLACLPWEEGVRLLESQASLANKIAEVAMNNVNGWMAIIMIAMVWMVVAVGEKLLIWGHEAWMLEVRRRAALRARGPDHLDDIVRWGRLSRRLDGHLAFRDIL
ncbi:hypothetical protein PG995_007738 [Apiospora arundinis]